VLLAWTLGRLGLVPIIIVSFGVSPALTAAALAMFIVADLYDGVLARQLDADGPSRRILDSLVDRAAIWSVYVAVCLAGYLPVVFLAALLVRDLYCGDQCRKMISARNVVIRADWMYRGLNLMLAGWVIAAPLLHAQLRLSLFAAVLGVSALVAADLRRAVPTVLGMDPPVSDAVLPAGEVRRQRALRHPRRVATVDESLRSA
jgi:phosphatidylglycerophosphate synthase